MNKPEFLSRIDTLASSASRGDEVVTMDELMAVVEWYGLIRTKEEYELLIYNIANNIAPVIYRGVKLKVTNEETK